VNVTVPMATGGEDSSSYLSLRSRIIQRPSQGEVSGSQSRGSESMFRFHDISGAHNGPDMLQNPSRSFSGERRDLDHSDHAMARGPSVSTPVTRFSRPSDMSFLGHWAL